MSDKVKLIIEIPKEHYDDMKASNCWWSGLKKCVMNGIPLDDVKAEINKCHITSGVKNQGVWNECVDSILRTIDYIPSVEIKAESEG